jgi:hypothetical protein
MRSLITRFLTLAFVGVTFICGAASLAIAAAQPSASTAGDLLFGVWNLNVPKSKYVGAPTPKGQTRTYEVDPRGVKTRIRTTYADGQSADVEYVADYDGVEYPLIGSPDYDAIALKRINAFAAEATLTHAGRLMAKVVRLISEDGKTMTITVRDGNGALRSIAVYDKQPH